MMEIITPLFKVKDIDEILAFYSALGFNITYQQSKPYIYLAVQRGKINIHFMSNINSASCLIHIDDVTIYHKAFADGLRAKYGKVPVKDIPRITRLKPNQTRFTLYDPAGNSIIFIRQDEPDIDYDAYDETLSPLMQALENVKFLRDTYDDDVAAAKFLDKKLAKLTNATPIDRARALAIRAELAIVLGDMTHAQTIREMLKQIPLSQEEQALYQVELQASDVLEKWLTQDD
jgi:hypothetical protein